MADSDVANALVAPVEGLHLPALLALPQGTLVGRALSEIRA